MDQMGYHIYLNRRKNNMSDLYDEVLENMTKEDIMNDRIEQVFTFGKDGVEFRIIGPAALINTLNDWLNFDYAIVQGTQHYTAVVQTSVKKLFPIEKIIDLWYGNEVFAISEGTTHKVEWRVQYNNDKWSDWYTSYENHVVIERELPQNYVHTLRDLSKRLHQDLFEREEMFEIPLNELKRFRIGLRYHYNQLNDLIDTRKEQEE